MRRRAPGVVVTAVALASSLAGAAVGYGETPGRGHIDATQATSPREAAGLISTLSWPSRRDPAPEPGLGPDQVIGIVLNALRHNDDPIADHGIAVTFAFTSPENHDITGPIDHFRALVKSSAYRPMLGHTRADRGPVVVVAEHARERVAITGAHGERAVYVFLLSRQETGTFKGCWMADGVLREADSIVHLQPPSLLTPVVLHQD